MNTTNTRADLRVVQDHALIVELALLSAQVEAVVEAMRSEGVRPTEETRRTVCRLETAAELPRGMDEPEDESEGDRSGEDDREALTAEQRNPSLAQAFCARF